jgi:hypothetical protein
MTKETKKTTKKSPLLEEETVEETPFDSIEEEVEIDEEVEVEETPAPKAVKKTVVEAPKVNSDQGLKNDAKNTQAILEKEDKVMFMIPLAQGEKAGAVHDCFINGHKISVRKGAMVSIPESVAKLLADAYEIQMEAGSEFAIDSSNEKLDALN